MSALSLVALLLVALLLAAPASAQEPRPPQATISAAKLGEIFSEVAQATATGNRAESSRLLVGIVGDPSMAPAHGQAWAMLADNFEQLDLDLASIVAWGKALALDPDVAAPHVGRALALADAMGERDPVAAGLAANLSIPVEAALINRVAHVAALYHLHNEDYGAAQGALMLGDANQPGFEDIELLRGVVLSLQGRAEDAIPPMLIAEAMGRQAGRDARFVNRANLNIARANYAVENYTQAILYYAKIDRSSDFWLDAQFERAWAHFRGNDTNGALAMLFTHQSPFFDVGYFNPEADLLRAYALFIMCKFPDATKEINKFQAKWEPIRDAYRDVSLTPEQAFNDVASYLDGGTPMLPLAIVRQFEHEDRMRDAVAAAAHATEELARAQGIGAEVGELAVQLVSQLRAEQIRREGQRVLSRIEGARQELNGLLTDIEITRLDLLNLESQMYSRAAATGVLDYGDHLGRLRELKRRKGFRVWPWQGEYWADELGWFVFNARPDCPDSMAVGAPPG